MRMRKFSHLFSYMLLGLLILFSVLYWFDPSILERNLKDFWASLLAGVIAALLIEGIIESSKKEKNEQSRQYVERRLVQICTSLIYGMAPAMQLFDIKVPMKWENALKTPFKSGDWEFYYKNVSSCKDKVLMEIQNVAYNLRDLLDAELQLNTLFLLEYLEQWAWNFWYREDIDEFTKDIFKLRDVSDLAETASRRALKILETNKLLVRHTLSDKVKDGKLIYVHDEKRAEEELKRAQNIFSQTIKFSEAVKKKELAGN